MSMLESVLPTLVLLYSSVMIKNYPFLDCYIKYLKKERLSYLGEVVGDNDWLIICITVCILLEAFRNSVL
jgi:hypothetical protein